MNEGHRNMPRLHALKQFCTCLDSCTCQDYMIYALTVCMLTKPLCNAENLIICLLFTPREKMQRQTLLLSLEANLHNRQKQNLRNYFWASQTICSAPFLDIISIVSNTDMIVWILCTSDTYPNVYKIK